MTAGINTALDIARQAIAANQYGLSVTGQNIANVDNTKYSRQLVELNNGTSVQVGKLVFGTGVAVAQIASAVDNLLQAWMNRQESTTSAYGEMATNLSYIGDVFSLDTANSLDALFSDFWNRWSELSNTPTGTAERSGMLESGGAIVEQLNDMSESMTSLTGTINERIKVAVDSINSFAAQIDELNKSISAIEAQEGVVANDMRDQRSTLVSKLSSLLDITTYEQSDSTLLVTTARGSTILVSAGVARELSVSDGQIMWESTGGLVDISDKISGGSLGGWLDTRDEVIPKFQAELDALTKTVIWNVNYQHSQGVGLTYFSDTVNGSYAVDDSGLISTLDYATSVDTAGDFSMWIENAGVYEEVTVDLSAMAPVSAAAAGIPMAVSGTAASVSDTYVLTVSPPGADIGGASDVTVNWTCAQGYGSFTVAAGDTTAVVDVDGIQIAFSGVAGPFEGDTFVINTDADGVPSENVSDYTLQDFADAFNIEVASSAFPGSITASVVDGRIVFGAASGYQLAFSDESGLAAALGVNTFFTGSAAMDIGINGQLSDTDYIAAGQLDSSGEIAAGDNSNALLLAECGELGTEIVVYEFDRTADPSYKTSTITTNTDAYYQTIVSNLGIITDSVDRNLETAESLISELQEQRDTVSGVSLDEEMINLMKYQNAYNAASKLLTVVNEMLETIVSTI